LFRHLSPDWDSLPVARHKLLDSSPVKEKQDAAEEIASACKYYQQKVPIFPQSASREEPHLPTLLVSIGAAMSETLFPEPHRAKVIEHFEQWAWARLLEQVQCSEVFLSLNLFL